MAKTVIALEAKLEGGEKLGQTVGSIKKELREANAELISAQKNFGDYSAEAIAAAQKVAGLKDSIKDAKETADLFDPGKKFQALTNVLNVAAGGFAALQGAQALFGAESEELQKTLVKVQGALALSQGLSQIAEAGEAFGRLGAAMQSIPALQKAITLGQKAWNAAMAANPIGLLVAAIVAVIAAIGGLITWFSKSSAAARANAAAVAESTRALENNKKALDESANALQADSEYKIAMAKATGKSKDEVRKLILAEQDAKIALQEKALSLNRAKLATDQYTLSTLKANDADEEQIKKQEDNVKNQQEFVNQINNNVKSGYEERLKIVRSFEIEDAAADTKRQEDRVAKEKAANDKLIAARKELIEKQKALEKELSDFLFNRTATDLQIGLKQIQEDYDKRLQIAKGNADLRVLVEKARIAAERDLYQKEAPPETIRTQQIIDETNKQTQTKIEGAKIATAGLLNAINAENTGFQEGSKFRRKLTAEEVDERLQLTSNALGAIGQLLDQQSAAGKAVAVAQAIINTYQGATKALAQAGIFGKIAAATVIVSGLASVKKILSQKLPSQKGSGSVASSGGGGVSIPSVSAPVQPEAETTRLDQTSINAVGNAASRAFVLETDVSNNQERIRRLNRAARIN